MNNFYLLLSLDALMQVLMLQSSSRQAQHPQHLMTINDATFLANQEPQLFV